MSQERKVNYKQYLVAFKVAYTYSYIVLLAAGKYTFRKGFYVKLITKDFYKDEKISVLMWKRVISYSIAFQVLSPFGEMGWP